MNIGNVIGIVIITLLVGIFIDLSIYFTVKYFHYKKSEGLNISFEEAFTVLGVIIQSELQVYDTDVFLGRGGITNSNFETYYEDISKKIIAKISPDSIKELQHYITEDAIYIYVARRVRAYLTEQINPALPTNNE